LSARKALGKGLGALIPGAGEGKETHKASAPNRVGIERIGPSKYQPRLDFDEVRLDQLAESIRAQGVIEPLVVRPSSDGADAPYELIAGERRWRAAQKAGLDMVPVVIREMDDREALETALTENLQREDLNPIEEARAYRMLIDEFELTQEQTAARVGADRSTVANALRLLKLDAAVQDDIIWGKLSAGHARALLQLEGTDRKKLHKLIIERELSVRATEATARKMADNTGKKASKTDTDISAAIKQLEERLARELGTKVVIRTGKRGGSVEIKFADNKQLEGICHRLME